MIRYSSETKGLGLPENVICYMLDLWNDYGTISGRTLICLPEGEWDLQIFLFDAVVAIPDIGLSFRKPAIPSTTAIAHVIRKMAHTSESMAVALAATILVMVKVVNRMCERFDSQTNLADIAGITLDPSILGSTDEISF